MDPELNKYILMNEAKGLVPGYPQSMLDILGKCNIAAVHGSTHKYMRGALLSLISPTMIREQLLPTIDVFMRTHLSNWDNKVIDIQQKTKEMALLSSLKQIAGSDSSSISQAFMPEFFKLVLGTLSLPIDLPAQIIVADSRQEEYCEHVETTNRRTKSIERNPPGRAWLPDEK
ncbi:hypothetical protein GH714_031086 [Hevea brasiliensis]|uniref:Cytochrome P450 n=1 Tax=Hevea brasiliensis TaxID=3981 RepID=A0A6A6LCS4_HEVBR|nr:hypothetical protein GH714_031086 [Hevea brasiliensis]